MNRDTPSGAALRVFDGPRAAIARAVHVDRPVVEVHVLPTERLQLACSEEGIDGHGDEALPLERNVLARDEAEELGRVEKLDRTSRHGKRFRLAKGRNVAKWQRPRCPSPLSVHTQMVDDEPRFRADEVDRSLTREEYESLRSRRRAESWRAEEAERIAANRPREASRFCGIGLDGLRPISAEEFRRRARLRDQEVEREQGLAAMGSRKPGETRFCGVEMEGFRPITLAEFERAGKARLAEIEAERQLKEKRAQERKAAKVKK